MEVLISIVFNEKFEDINAIILDEDIVLTEYQTKEYYKKPNPSVNIFIALFTTVHARLKLYELFDHLKYEIIKPVGYTSSQLHLCRKRDEDYTYTMVCFKTLRKSHSIPMTFYDQFCLFHAISKDL